MKMFVVLALAAVAYAEPEAEAFNPLVYTAGVAPVRATYNHVAAPLTTYSHAVSAPVSAYVNAPVSTYVNAPVSTYSHAVATPVASYVAKQVATPVVSYAAKQVATPVVSSYAAAPVVSTYNQVATPVVSAYNHVAAPVSTYAAAVPVAHQALTSYNNPHHYTAVGNGITAPKYVAKNHGVEHVVKREAEAEADAQFITPSVYTQGLVNSVAPVNTVAYSAPVAYTNAVHHSAAVAPVTYTNAVPHSVAAPVAYTNTVAAPVTYTNTMTYAAKPVMTYNAMNTIAAGHHAVAATPFGYTHSSNVGLCYNNMGVQVSC